MNLLAEILSSKVRAEIFRIFWSMSAAECHLREIERRAGCSIGSIQQEVKRLEQLGLLIRRKDGNRSYFKANRDHPIYPEIHRMVLKTSGMIDVLHAALSSEGIQFAFVFGSIAQGTEKPESDVDLFIIGKTSLRDLSKRFKEPAQILGREINPHLMSIEEWNQRLTAKEHFVSSVASSEKMMIYGDEHELEKLGSKRLAEKP
jgi:predicted nucleotidyltransferase